MQKPYFGNAKTILWECENHTFGTQKPYFGNLKMAVLDIE